MYVATVSLRGDSPGLGVPIGPLPGLQTHLEECRLGVAGPWVPERNKSCCPICAGCCRSCPLPRTTICCA